MTQQADPKADPQNQDPNNPGNVPDNPEVVPADPQNPDPPAPDPIVELATELGWNPDYAGPNAVNARTYILRSREINDSLSKNVRSLRREMNALREGVETVKWSAEQAGKQEIARLNGEIAQLKNERMEAIRAGRVDDVPSYDQRIEALQDATRTAGTKPPAQAPTSNPDWDDWVEDNKWYNTDAELQEYANSLSHTPDYQALPFSSRLERIGKAVRKMYPEKFNTTTKQSTDPPPTNSPAAQPHSAAAVPPVSPSHQRARPQAKTKATAADLSYEERRAGESFVNQGLFKSLDEYAQKLQEREQALTNRR